MIWVVFVRPSVTCLDAIFVPVLAPLEKSYHHQ